jgi:hypothetical protein
MITKVTIELDQEGLEEVIASLESHRKRIVAIGAAITAQAQAQVSKDVKLQARKAKKAPAPVKDDENSYILGSHKANGSAGEARMR